jgi:alkyl hydroperoxide reductase subunit F
MLDAGLKTQLTSYLQNLRQPIALVASLDDSAGSAEMKALLEDIVSTSDKVSLNLSGEDDRKPSFAITRAAGDASVRFAGLPLGHEFTSLVLALLHVGGHPPRLDAEVIERIQALDGDYRFETYFSQSCQNCPDVVQALNTMSALNPRITHVAIDGALFQAEVEARQVMAVPTILLNGEAFGQGRMEVEQILAKLDTGAADRMAQKIKTKDAFDVLVIGGAPLGPRPPSTPPARVSAPASRPNASAARCWTPWPSRTSSRCPTPKARRWPRRWSSTSRTTTSTS